MKVSVIFTVLDSHEVVRRQILYFNSMNLPDDVEVVVVDDGSNPPIKIEGNRFNLVLHHTNDFRPWTQPIARWKGVKLSKGTQLIFVDIDHIVTFDLIQTVIDKNYDWMKFKRRYGVLDESGKLRSDKIVALQYGIPQSRIDRFGLRTGPPGNCFSMRRTFYEKLSSEKAGPFGSRDLIPLKRIVRRLGKNGKAYLGTEDERPLIYVFPSGRHCGDVDANPFNLFHNLSRKTDAYQDTNHTWLWRET